MRLSDVTALRLSNELQVAWDAAQALLAAEPQGQEVLAEVSKLALLYGSVPIAIDAFRMLRAGALTLDLPHALRLHLSAPELGLLEGVEARLAFDGALPAWVTSVLDKGTDPRFSLLVLDSQLTARGEVIALAVRVCCPCCDHRYLAEVLLSLAMLRYGYCVKCFAAVELDGEQLAHDLASRSAPSPALDAKLIADANRVFQCRPEYPLFAQRLGHGYLQMLNALAVGRAYPFQSTEPEARLP